MHKPVGSSMDRKQIALQYARQPILKTLFIIIAAYLTYRKVEDLMSTVAVIDQNKIPLAPCHPAVARRLLKEGKAAVFKRFPFIIILKRPVDSPNETNLTLNIDPGSKTTGIALTDPDGNIIACFELNHRKNIKKALADRAGHRRSRRTRKLRHRPARFQNRTRPKGWLPPTLESRVSNIATWVNRLCKIYPIAKIAVEHVKFDTQLMENPEIRGIEYQRGTLYGTEIWEYLLEKFGRKCFYCGAKGIPLEKEHIIPKSKGGSNRVSNLTVACRPCNQEKGNRHPNEIDGKLGKRVQSALHAGKKPLKNAAHVNSIRWKVVETLKETTGLPIILGTGGKTKYHRKKAGLPKTHYYDAASVNCVPKKSKSHSVLVIHAVGYGHRQDLGKYQTIQTAPGFKRPYIRTEHAGGFQKLDIVKMKTKKGTFIGSINSFDKTADGKPQKLRIKTGWEGDKRKSGNIRQLRKIQCRDGYAYEIKQHVSTDEKHSEP